MAVLDDATGAIAGRQLTTAAPRLAMPVAMAPAVAHHAMRRLGASGRASNRATGGGGGKGFNAAFTTSAVNGGWRKRTPVASKIALAMAAVPGTDEASPAPSGASPWRGIIITSMTGTSRKFRMG